MSVDREANSIGRNIDFDRFYVTDVDSLPKSVKEAAWEGLKKGASYLYRLARYGATAKFVHALFGGDKPRLLAALTHLVTSGQDPYLAVDVAQSMFDTDELSQEFIAAVKAKLASSPDIMKHHLFMQDFRKILGMPVE